MVYLFVGLGGVMGAVLRYTLGTWIGVRTDMIFPFPTLFINLSGCFILAFFYTITTTRFTVHPHIRTSFGTGFVGSFTTFSTFSYETLELLQNGRYIFASAYIIASLIGGYAFAYVGVKLGCYEKAQPSHEGRDR